MLKDIPKEQDLKPGEIYPIFLNWRGLTDFEGFAELISPAPTTWREHNMQFVYKEYETKVLTLAVQRWKVKFLRTGFVTHRYIFFKPVLV